MAHTYAGRARRPNLRVCAAPWATGRQQPWHRRQAKLLRIDRDYHARNIPRAAITSWRSKLDRRAAARPVSGASLREQLAARSLVVRWAASVRRVFGLDGALVQCLGARVEFGDWLSAAPSKTVDEMSSAFNHAQAIRMARDMAIALGESSAVTYTTAYQNAQQGFHELYWRNSTYGSGEQAALALALYLGAPPAAQVHVVLSQLLRTIEGDEQCRPCLATGILSTKWLLETLSLYGRTDVGLSLALKTVSPSWGHMVLMNSTTITESWVSVDEKPPLLTSHNHPALASIGAWFFRFVAGLRLNDNTPGLPRPNSYGYARILFAPGCVTDARVPHARARLTSPHGPVSSYWAWDARNQSLRLDISVPSNSVAEIWTPSVIAPQHASVVAVDDAANDSAVVWHYGHVHLPRAGWGVLGVRTVSPRYATGGGDGSLLISIEVGPGTHSFVVDTAIASSHGRPRLKTPDEEAPLPRLYSAVATRVNGARPIISSHDAGCGPGYHTARSTFTFNFNPTLLTLPNGTQALLVRCSNGTNASTASTKANPDYLALAKIHHVGSDGLVVVDDLTDASIAVVPEANAAENRGVQDPRVMQDLDTGTYWLAISTYGDSGVGLAIARSQDGLQWETVKHCSGVADGCGKSGTILYHNASHHYMFWGPGAVNVAVSSDYMNWTTMNSTAAFGRKNWLTGETLVSGSDVGRGIWAEPGPTPQRLSDGNYFFVVIEAGVPAGHAPCPRVDPNGQKGGYWGAGWVILDGKDPTKILQHKTRLLFATTEWEVNSTTGSGGAWEMHVCCIGATSAIAPVPGEVDTFMIYYGAGDAVTGAAKVVVKVPGG